jgi:Fe2+ or Zn2+ uptake regulation protein
MKETRQTQRSILRGALEANGHRYTEQRAAVFDFLVNAHSHPTADEVFLSVRPGIPGISLATVYKSLETLVGCGLATKLTYGDGSARYDGRTEPHHNARCCTCGKVFDVPGRLSRGEVDALAVPWGDFAVTGYRLEFTGYCGACRPDQAATA